MKRFFVTIAFCAVWWLVHRGALPTAQAVVPEPTRTVPAPEAAAPVAEAAPTLPADARAVTTVVQKVEIPIAWQRTKARMVGKGTSNLTESFREVWTLELRPGGYLYLESPRARVAVFPASVGEPRQTLPRAIVLAESDFARLVGVIAARPGDADTADAVDAPGIAGRPLTINLAKTGKGGSDITLAWSEDEHYAIHLDISSTALF